MLAYGYLGVIDMLINEVSKITRLTKKAIEYYVSQGLISPAVLENRYRDYNAQDIKKLNKISVLRKLDVCIEDIRHILNDTTNTALQSESAKKELEYQRDFQKNSLLQRLSQGTPYDEISLELRSMERNRIITDRLLEAFPGYYGRVLCMHFAEFLKEPIQTESQQIAYETVLSFLDNLPALEIPKELEEFFTESTCYIGTDQISEMDKVTKHACQNPDEFLSESKEILEQYFEYKKSDEYKNSPASKLMERIKGFNASNGYNDIFIPAMKKLSPSYAEYYQQLEDANKKLLEQYPEIEQL